MIILNDYELKENVDYDYFSIQVEDLHAEKTYGDMYYASCKQSYENICKNYQIMLDEHNI